MGNPGDNPNHASITPSRRTPRRTLRNRADEGRGEKFDLVGWNG